MALPNCLNRVCERKEAGTRCVRVPGRAIRTPLEAALPTTCLGLLLVGVQAVFLLAIESLCQQLAIPHSGYERELDHARDAGRPLVAGEARPDDKGKGPFWTV